MKPGVVTERKPPSLTARTVRGFVWAFTGSVGQAVLQIAATIVLARLLTPQEFGSVAAALLVVGLAQLLTQVGVSAALVQRRALNSQIALTAERVQTIYTTLLGVPCRQSGDASTVRCQWPIDYRTITFDLPMLGFALPTVGCTSPLPRGCRVDDPVHEFRPPGPARPR